MIKYCLKMLKFIIVTIIRTTTIIIIILSCFYCCCANVHNWACLMLWGINNVMSRISCESLPHYDMHEFFNVIIICTDFSAFVNNYKREKNTKEIIPFFHHQKIVETMFIALLNRVGVIIIRMIKAHKNTIIKDGLKC